MSEQPFRNIEPISTDNTNSQNEAANDPNNLRPMSIAVGSGNKALYSDYRGTWWGNENPTKAPIWFTMDGNVEINMAAATQSTLFRFKGRDGKYKLIFGIRKTNG